VLSLSEIHFERDRIPLFENLSLTVHAGQKVGIVGRNGAGKSTLFQLILGRLQPDSGTVSRPPEWRVSYLAQDPAVSERSALDYVIDGHKALRQAQRRLARIEAEPDPDPMRLAALHGELQDLDAYSAEARAGQILYGLGFSPGDAARGYADFSGGWRIRLNLAQALMAPAELLLLDEPTNHLDLEATLWLEQWLERSDSTLLTIAHDREFLDNVVDHIVHLEGRRAYSYRGNYSAFEIQRTEALTRQQASYVKQQRQVAHIRDFVDRFRAKASKARQVQSRLKALERMEAVAPAHADSPYQFTFPDPEKMSQPLLSLNDVSIGYDPAKPVLTGVKATLLPGARIGVLGENGAGKSTLLKSLVGDLQPLGGELVRGQHSSIGYFAQHQLENLDPDESALSGLQRAHPDQREQWCRDYLGTWGFPRDKVERPVRTLSGGERARLVLARIAATRPAILVLDEPTNHLDLEMREALALALQEFSGALVIVAHDRSLLARTVDEFWLVENGSVERLKGTLDTYARAHNRATMTLAAREPDGATSPPRPEVPTTANDAAGGNRRKAQRQAAAARREREKPLRDRAARLERRIDELGAALTAVEQRLADPEVYRNLPPDELDGLLKEAGRLRKKRDDAEQEWLATAEELEAVQAT